MKQIEGAKVKQTDTAQTLNMQGSIQFSLEFTARPSELNPDGAVANISAALSSILLVCGSCLSPTASV